MRHAQMSRERRTNPRAVKDLSFYLETLESFFGQRVKLSFQLEVEAQSSHAAQEPPLLKASHAQ